MRRHYFYAGVFVLCASVMMLQVLETRLLSVESHYYLAFLSISMAMLGMTAGAVYLHYRCNDITESLPRSLAHFSFAYSLSIAASLLLQISQAPVQIASATVVLVWAEVALVLSTPFFFAGICVSLALTRSPFPVGAVYAADLSGAAAGCLGVLGLLGWLDAPSAILAVAAIAAVAAGLFSRSVADQLPGQPVTPRLYQSSFPLAAVLFLAAVFNAMTIHGLQPVLVKDKVDDRMQVEYEKWNTYSRIQVRYPWVDTPWLWSPSDTLPATYSVEQRSMNIDGDAGTVMFGFDGKPQDAAFLQYDVTNVAYRLRNTGKAAVIGVGGGRDVLSAWVSGFRDITAVELNPIFIDLLTTREPFASFAGLAALPGIHFHVDEARSWFARTDEHFDLIQMSLIDTWAATGAGAYSLSENGLYTLQGWRRFVGALTPTGIFTVSRWFSPGDLDETGRMIALAVRELIDMGVSEPEAHIALVANGNLATLLLSRQPLTQAELGTLHQLAGSLKFQLVLAPDMPAQSTLLQSIIRSKTPEQLDRLVSRLSVDLTPPTDDRPFFFNQLPLARAWTEALDWQLYNRTGVKAGNLLASVTLLIILVLATLFVIIVILVPLRPAIRAASARLAIAGSAYFVCLGLGFMFVEIGLLQRLSLFLGHPVYSLSIVLFGLVLATGIGSFLSERLPLSSAARFGVWSLLVSAYIVSLNFWLPAAFATIESSGIFIRGAAAVAVILPAGLLMGFGFPSGMRMVLRQNPAPAPWFWGINGAAGVLGSIIAVALSITGGISTTLLAGSACYVALIPAAVFLQAGSLESRKLRLSNWGDAARS